MFKSLFEILRKPPPDVLAASELDDNERELLKAQSGLEYAQCMVNYRSATVTRLKSRNQPQSAKVLKIGRAA